MNWKDMLNVGTLLGIGFFCLCLLHGLANTIDGLALVLHRFALSVRKLQDARTSTIRTAWLVQDLEDRKTELQGSPDPERYHGRR